MRRVTNNNYSIIWRNERIINWKVYEAEALDILYIDILDKYSDVSWKIEGSWICIEV